MTAGSTFFDNDAIFATYTQNRQQRLDNPNDTLEKPVMLELIGTVGAKAILDLGCGDAAISRELLQQGATAYLGRPIWASTARPIWWRWQAKL